MENINPKHLQSQQTLSKHGRTGIKLLIIFGLSLLLLIPQAFIMNMVTSADNTEAADLEISEQWGPPGRPQRTRALHPRRQSAHNIYILPETLTCKGNIKTRTLSRGIFDFSVYEAPLQISGTFVLPKELTAEQLSHLRVDRARILFSVDDFRAFTDNPTLTYGNGRPIELSSEGYNLGPTMPSPGCETSNPSSTAAKSLSRSPCHLRVPTKSLSCPLDAPLPSPSPPTAPHPASAAATCRPSAR